MKYAKALSLIAVVALVLGGCSFRLASSVDELIAPVSPSGDNAGVQYAMDSFCKDGYSLKNPAGGEYKNSYIFYDINSDDVKEAIVFYEPSANPGTIDMAVIFKTPNGWSVAYNVEGEGSDVYSVDFKDLNGDNTPEFIVLWDSFINSQSHTLTVYRQSENDGSYSLESIGRNITMNDYIAIDFDGDKKDELLVLTVDSGDSISANAVLYSYDDDGAKSLGSTKLDGHISSYKSIISENADGNVLVYADAVKSNGSQMLTEVITWSDYYNTIISPFYSYSTGITKKTTRLAMLTCRDIDGDGRTEIPLDASDAPYVPPQVEAVNWKQYVDSVLDHKCYSLAVEKDNYQIIIPDDYFDDIAVSYDTENSLLTVNDKNENMLFTVVFLPKSQLAENSDKYSGYTEIMSDSGYVYLASCGKGANIQITVDNLKNMIKTYEGD